MKLEIISMTTFKVKEKNKRRTKQRPRGGRKQRIKGEINPIRLNNRINNLEKKRLMKDLHAKMRNN